MIKTNLCGACLANNNKFDDCQDMDSLMEAMMSVNLKGFYYNNVLSDKLKDLDINIKVGVEYLNGVMELRWEMQEYPNTILNRISRTLDALREMKTMALLYLSETPNEIEANKFINVIETNCHNLNLLIEQTDIKIDKIKKIKQCSVDYETSNRVRNIKVKILACKDSLTILESDVSKNRRDIIEMIDSARRGCDICEFSIDNTFYNIEERVDIIEQTEKAIDEMVLHIQKINKLIHNTIETYESNESDKSTEISTKLNNLIFEGCRNYDLINEVLLLTEYYDKKDIYDAIYKLLNNRFNNEIQETLVLSISMLD